MKVLKIRKEEDDRRRVLSEASKMVLKKARPVPKRENSTK